MLTTNEDFYEKLSILDRYLDTCSITKKYKDKIVDKNFLLRNPYLYIAYSDFFSPCYKDLSTEVVQLLSISGYLYYKYLIIIDNVIDSQHLDNYKINFENVIISNICQEESIKILASLFPLNNNFWKTWNKRKEEYLASQVINNMPNTIQHWDDYIKYAEGKSAFGKVAIDALFELSELKNIELYEKLLLIHSNFHIGFQIYDDYIDFKEDFKSKQINIFNYELNKHLSTNNQNEILDPDYAFKILHFSGIVDNILNESLTYFQLAHEQTIELQLHSIENYIKHHIFDIKRRIFNLKTYIKSIEISNILKKEQKNKLQSVIQIPPITNKMETIAVEMFNYIYSQWSEGYGELQHVLYIPKEEGFLTESEFHYGDIFQRAIITEILCDANVIFQNSLSPLVDFEVQYLLSKRLDTSPFGWSYLPTLTEIAADTDDLGQIIQVFIKANKENYVDDYCLSLINILINERTNIDGGIETWIIPKQNCTELQKRQIQFNETKWGVGPDVEVMSNFLYSLVLYNKKLYYDYILKGCEYILERQDEKGFWKSKWYYGSYYGTYVCVRLFASMGYGEKSLSKVLDFLKTSQNQDGGWGLNENSDSLNTSLSIITLFYLKNILNNNDEIDLIIKKSIHFIIAKYNDKNLLQGVHFIKPRLFDSLISKTITSSYVLKACCEIIKNNFSPLQK